MIETYQTLPGCYAVADVLAKHPFVLCAGQGHAEIAFAQRLLSFQERIERALEGIWLLLSHPQQLFTSEGFRKDLSDRFSFIGTEKTHFIIPQGKDNILDFAHLYHVSPEIAKNILERGLSEGQLEEVATFLRQRTPDEQTTLISLAEGIAPEEFVNRMKTVAEWCDGANLPLLPFKPLLDKCTGENTGYIINVLNHITALPGFDNQEAGLQPILEKATSFPGRETEILTFAEMVYGVTGDTRSALLELCALFPQNMPISDVTEILKAMINPLIYFECRSSLIPSLRKVIESHPGSPKDIVQLLKLTLFASKAEEGAALCACADLCPSTEDIARVVTFLNRVKGMRCFGFQLEMRAECISQYVAPLCGKNASCNDRLVMIEVVLTLTPTQWKFFTINRKRVMEIFTEQDDQLTRRKLLQKLPKSQEEVAELRELFNSDFRRFCERNE